MIRALWPAGEAAQADYEALRYAAVRGDALIGPATPPFGRGGLAGLIVRPVACPVFQALIVGSTRAPWTPYSDPRSEAMIAAYQVLLGAAVLGAAVLGAAVLGAAVLGAAVLGAADLAVSEAIS